MKRKEVPQISNATWFPALLRKCIHEFMTWFVKKVNAAQPFMPIIEEGLSYSDKIIVIDQEVGAGFEVLDPLIDLQIPRITVSRENIGQEGLYVMVNSFHQLRPNQAKNTLEAVAKINQPIVVVEGNNDSLWQVFGMVIIVPLTVLLTAPFVKPFRISRLFFTYIIPILPLITFLDGFIALFKLYAPGDLEELVKDLKKDTYEWRSGKLDNGRGGKIIYLIGHPVSVAESNVRA